MNTPQPYCTAIEDEIIVVVFGNELIELNGCEIDAGAPFWYIMGTDAWFEKQEVNNDIFLVAKTYNKDFFSIPINNNTAKLLNKEKGILVLTPNFHLKAEDNVYFKIDSSKSIKSKGKLFKNLDLENNKNLIRNEITEVLSRTKENSNHKTLEYLCAIDKRKINNLIYFLYKTNMNKEIKLICYNSSNNLWLIGETLIYDVKKEQNLKDTNYNKWFKTYGYLNN